MQDGEPQGRCVPMSVLSSEQANGLAAADCSGRDIVCAPAPLVSDEHAALPACHSALGSEGRCLSECLLGQTVSALLERADCRKAERCVPCSQLGAGTGGCP